MPSTKGRRYPAARCIIKDYWRTDIVIAQEGLRRLNRLSVYLAICSVAGLLLWLVVFLTAGRLGITELIVFVFLPLVPAISLRIISWLLEGFLLGPRNPNQSQQ